MSNDNVHPRTFVDLMALEAVTGIEGALHKYMSKVAAFTPGGGSAYGGHVYAQSVWAASQTVEDGMVVHSVHGYFTLPGLVDRPYIYTITPLSNARSYCSRSVTVRQPIHASSVAPGTTLAALGFDPSDAESEMGEICFACICSFKRDEKKGTNHQARGDLRKKYAAVLAGMAPEMHQPTPNVDTPWYQIHISEYPQVNDFPGLDTRKVDMTRYNAFKSPIAYRQLSYYRLIGSIPPTQYNLHACAHLYASDRNSLFVICNALGFGDQIGSIGSLSHSVIFHVSSKDMVLKEGEWVCQEAWTPRSEGGRGMHESRLWDGNGTHIASTWQDGLVRKGQTETEQKHKKKWFEEMGRLGKLYIRRRTGLGRYKL